MTRIGRQHGDAPVLRLAERALQPVEQALPVDLADHQPDQPAAVVERRRRLLDVVDAEFLGDRRIA